jgi:hypothetical protein
MRDSKRRSTVTDWLIGGGFDAKKPDAIIISPVLSAKTIGLDTSLAARRMNPGIYRSLGILCWLLVKCISDKLR